MDPKTIRGVEMRKYLLLLGIIFFFVACSEKNQINDPVNEDAAALLKIPASDNQLIKSTTFAQMIDGSIGGIISIDYSYATRAGKTIKITGKLNIPANAFAGFKYIKVTLDDQYAAIMFSPSVRQFDIPLILDLKYEGLDLTGIDQNKINFYYLSDDDKKIEVINEKEKVFDTQSGTVQVIQAVLTHFSRFGWVI